MSQAPSMPMFVDAMIADTLHLDSELFGAYHFILYATWRNSGDALADDDATLARICRMPLPKWKRVRPVLAKFFDVSDGTWRQKRLEKEWSYVQERAERARQNGMRGGRRAEPKPEPKHEPKNNPVGSSRVTQKQSTHTQSQEDTPSSLRSDPPHAEQTAADVSRGTRLPREFEAPDDWIEWAISQGLSRQKAEHEASKFKDFWTAKAGKDGRKADWQATWRNWIRRAIEDGQRRGTQPVRPGGSTLAAAGADLLDDLRDGSMADA